MNDDVRFSKVMRLRFRQFLRGKSLVQLICAFAVAMTSFLHVEACFASAPRDGIAFSTQQDDDHGAGDQMASECCHFCSGTAITSFVTPIPRKMACTVIPSAPARSLITFKLPATAPPPKS
jgi:hypothetical protein